MVGGDVKFFYLLILGQNYKVFCRGYGAERKLLLFFSYLVNDFAVALIVYVTVKASSNNFIIFKCHYCNYQTNIEKRI